MKLKKLIGKTKFGPRELETLIEVELPDMSNLKHEVSGDWGPNYTYQVDPTQSIIVRYKNQKSKEVLLEQRELKFKSPILKTEREQFPLHLDLVDQENGFSFTLKVDQTGECHLNAAPVA